MTTSIEPARPHAHDRLPGFRIIQGAAFALFSVLSVMILVDITRASMKLNAGWPILIAAIAGYIVADFLSGFVHFLADNFGTPETPFFGKAFVLPFREHHLDPEGILRHPFFIANGNNCLVSTPLLLAVVIFVPTEDSLAALLATVFSLSLALAILLTNQFHKWAHMENPSRVVQILQRSGLILSKGHHDLHHTSPFDTHYCITAGWWNPLLQRVRFFEIIKSSLQRIGF